MSYTFVKTSDTDDVIISRKSGFWVFYLKLIEAIDIADDFTVERDSDFSHERDLLFMIH